ncbi:hypothetical protein OF83DRAFT_1090171 [Amylostereum chailletii]|nr:hypothetical protein OF83DRAFT_1090171 [Amylostereum chailletii]
MISLSLHPAHILSSTIRASPSCWTRIDFPTSATMRTKRRALSISFLLLVSGLGEARSLAYRQVDHRGIHDLLPLRRGIGDLLGDADRPKPQDIPQGATLDPPLSHKELDSVITHQTASLTRLIPVELKTTALSTTHTPKTPFPIPVASPSPSGTSSTQPLLAPTPMPTPTPTNNPPAVPQNRSSLGSNSSWKIVGIAVIAVSIIGGGIMAAVFFDQWWGFLRDVCGGRKKRKGPGGDEELVPDWEKGSWEYKLDSRGTRYPSFRSPPPDFRSPASEEMAERSPVMGPGVGTFGRGVGGLSDYKMEMPSRAVVRDDARFYGDIYDGAYPPAQAPYSPPAAFEPVDPAHGHHPDQPYSEPGVHRSNTSTTFAPDETAYGGVVVSPVPR